MTIYNATPRTSSHPKFGILWNHLLWPDNAPRTTVPTDVAILDTVKRAGPCKWLMVDDSHGLNRHDLAWLVQRVKTLTRGPKVGIFGLPGCVVKACNLILPHLEQIPADVFREAKEMATVPVLDGKPLGYFVDAILPAPYLMSSVNQDTNPRTDAPLIDPLAAYLMVLEHTLHAARRVTENYKRPIIPVLWIGPDVVPQLIPREQVKPTVDRILKVIEDRGIDSVIVWDDPVAVQAGNEGPMTAVFA